MDQAKETRGSQHIEKLMQQLSPDSERYQVLATARQFKSSWVELGEWLARVSSGKRFAEWGFATFDDYCTGEIRIRRQTAEKLLLAYRFLERREQGLLERREQRPLPDYRSIDLLRQADEGEHFSMAEYGELRQAVVAEERSHPVIARQFRDIVHKHQPEMHAEHRHRNALTAAKRLSTCLHDIPDVPQEMLHGVARLIEFLQGRSSGNEVKGPDSGNS
jgi:hypothetical protein